MANLSNIANDVRTDMCKAMLDSIDASVDPGYVELHTAAEAALLVTITFNAKAFADPADGVAAVDVDPVISDTAVAGGNAAVAIFYNGDGVVRFKGTVTATGGGGAITIASVTIASGGTVTITGGTITMPAS